MENKLTITAIILMIAGFTYFGISGQESTHYCQSREIKANCLDLSSTGKTCYTFPAKTGGKRCTEGWKEIPFIETVSISDDLPDVSEQKNLKRMHCKNEGCK